MTFLKLEALKEGQITQSTKEEMALNNFKNDLLNEGLKYFRKSKAIKKAVKRATKKISDYPFRTSEEREMAQKLVSGISNIGEYIGKVESLYKSKKITKQKAKRNIRQLSVEIRRLQRFARKELDANFFKKSKLKLLFAGILTGVTSLALIFGDDIGLPDAGEVHSSVAAALAGSNSREISSKFIYKWEGLRLNPYHDQAGYPTVGVGNLLSKEKWADLSQFDSLTKVEAMDQFRKHLVDYENGVKRLFPDIKDPNKIAALTSFSFNVGLGALEKSELRDMILDGDNPVAIKKEWKTWNKADGKFLKGLLNRRNAELGLFYSAA